MISFKKSKFLKIVCLALVFCFGFQQTGLAEVTDLRDEPGVMEYMFTAVGAYVSSRAIKPDWSVAQAWTYTYIIPALSKQVVNMVGIKGTTGMVVSTMLATLATSKLDYSTSAEKLAAEATSKTAEEATKQATQEAVKPEALLKSIAKDFTSVFKTLFSAGGPIMKGAIIDALTAGVMTVIKEAVAKMFGKMKKYISEALGYLLSKYAGQHIRAALQKQFAVLLGFSPVGPTASGAIKDPVEVTLKTGEVKVLPQEEANKLPAETIEKIVKLEGDYYLFYKNVAVTRYYYRNGELVKTTVMELRPDYITLNQGIAIQAQQFRQQSRADDIRVAVQVLARAAGLKREVAILISSGAGSWMAGASVGEAAIRAAISVIIQRISREFKDPMHATYVLMFVSDLVKYIITPAGHVGKERYATEQEVQKYLAENPEVVAAYSQRYELSSEEARKQLTKDIMATKPLSIDFGRKDASLFDAFITASATRAAIDAFSFGRAQYGGPGNYLNWVSGNDVIYINRYTDYMKDVYNEGLGYAELAQYMGAYHNQTVGNVYSIATGEASKAFYVKRMEKRHLDEINRSLVFFDDTYARDVQGVLQATGQVKELIDSRISIELQEQATIEQLLSLAEAELATFKDETQIKQMQDSIAKLNEQYSASKNKIAQLQEQRDGIDKLVGQAQSGALFDQARKRVISEAKMGTLISVLAMYDPLLAATGAAALCNDFLLQGMNERIKGLQAMAEAVGIETEKGKEITTIINKLKDSVEAYRFNAQEVDNLRSTNGWQQLEAISGQPYVSIDQRVADRAGVLGVEFSPDAEQYLEELPKDILKQGEGRRLFGVAKYLDIIGGNPVYYARWRPEEKPRPEPVQPTLARSDIPMPVVPISAPIEHPIAGQPQLTPRTTMPMTPAIAPPAAQPVAPPDRMVISEFTQFPDYGPGAAQGANYYKSQGKDIGELPIYQVVKYTKTDESGNLVNIDGRNIGRVEIRAIKDGQVVWVDTGRRVDLEKGLEWTQKSPTRTFEGRTTFTPKGPVTETEIRKEVNPLVSPPVSKLEPQSGLQRIDTPLPAETAVTDSAAALPSVAASGSEGIQFSTAPNIGENDLEFFGPRITTPDRVAPQTQLLRPAPPDAGVSFAADIPEIPNAPESRISLPDSNQQPVVININRQVPLPVTASPGQQVAIPASAELDMLPSLMSQPQAEKTLNEPRNITMPTMPRLSPQAAQYLDLYKAPGVAKDSNAARQAYEKLRRAPVPKGMLEELLQQLPPDFDPTTLPPPKFVKRSDLVGQYAPLDSFRSGQIEYYDAFVPVFESKEQEIVYLIMSSTNESRPYPYYSYTQNSDPTTRTDVTGRVAQPNWAEGFWGVTRQLGLTSQNLQERNTNINP